jgi:SAM-dependent methyltransferase
MSKYDQDYFDWQKKAGVFGGIADKFKFSSHIDTRDVVIDFGSGGGYLLKNLNCKTKLGVEINEIARKESKKNGIDAVPSISDIKNDYADKIISNHALKHVHNPLGILKELRKKLKQGGSIVFVTPHDNAGDNYDPKDRNQHLYTWSCQNIGNLFKEAGYSNIEVCNIRHKWPPKYATLYRIFGLDTFHFICKINAFCKNNYQIKVIAQK